MIIKLCGVRFGSIIPLTLAYTHIIMFGLNTSKKSSSFLLNREREYVDLSRCFCLETKEAFIVKIV